MDAIEVTSVLAQSAGDLAEIHGLRGYDAVHLAAAILISADVVVSADAELLAAAIASGLAVIDARS
jgi:uncharacterized protein